MTKQEASEWGCIVSGASVPISAIVWFFGIRPPGQGIGWFAPFSFVMAFISATLFYLGKRFKGRKDNLKTEAFDSFRNPQWETVTRRQFMNERIEIDGKRFWDCTFNSVTLAFHGTAPAEFLGNCNFQLPLRLTTDFPPAMHFSKLAQIFSKLPGTRLEYVSADERGNPLTPTFEITELTSGTDVGRILPDTSLKDSKREDPLPRDSLRDRAIRLYDRLDIFMQEYEMKSHMQQERGESGEDFVTRRLEKALQQNAQMGADFRIQFESDMRSLDDQIQVRSGASYPLTGDINQAVRTCNAKMIKEMREHLWEGARTMDK